MTFDGARCLVTGGAGFIGSNLASALTRQGAVVTILDDLSTGDLQNVPMHARFVRGDISRYAGLATLVGESDYVFHLAAQVGNVRSFNAPQRDADTNVLGTVRLLDAARRSQVQRVVYASSSAIFGEADYLPIDEEHPQRPASFYALSKQTGEKYARLAHAMWNVPAICLRFFNVYGYPCEPSDYSGVIGIFMRRLAEHQSLEVYGTGQQTRDFIHVTDVVQAILRAAVAGTPGQLYNIGTGQATTIEMLAGLVGNAAGRPVTIQYREPRDGEVQHSVADVRKAKQDLAFQPAIDLQRGLAECWARSTQQRDSPPPRPDTRRVDRVLVFVHTPQERAWLRHFQFCERGLQAACVTFADVAGDQAVPEISAARVVLKDERPSAVLWFTAGAAADVVRIACELEGIPTFSVIATHAAFDRIPSGDRTPPHISFLATTEMLQRGLRDPRYGRTLIPTGHVDGDKDATAVAGRMLDAIQRRESLIAAPPPSLTVVVPAYREATNLDLVCDRLLHVFDANSIAAEILIVDDASPDRTYDVALTQMWKSARVRALTKPTPRGMGNAIRYGIERAGAPVIVVTMGDGSDEVERIPAMYRAIRDDGYALVIGSRYRSRENYAAVPGLYRFWSRCFRITARVLIGIRLTDYTNAFRAFDRRIFARYGPESGGFEISPEITFKAWFATRRVGEVDVRHLKRASGQSTFSFVRAGPGYGKVLIKAFVNRITGRWFTLDW